MQAAPIRTGRRPTRRAVTERANRARLLAIAVSVAAVTLAAILFILYRQRRIIETRDAAYLEQQRLASQMNPHFLFNALNSIKALMIDDRRDEAIRHLTRFAQLVRRILYASINESVTLEEELKNCALYAEIEMERLGGDVDFAVEVDDALDVEGVAVPPLLLQPFLENAFWHGLQAKPGDRRLRVRAEPLAGEGARVTVADNGIGRDAAARNRRSSRRQSVGIDITERRLRHFARRHGRSAEVEIRDLVDADGVPAGTEVVLEIR